MLGANVRRCWMSTTAVVSAKLLNKIKFLPMPKLSPTMGNGRIVHWYIEPQQHVTSYQLALDVAVQDLVRLGEKDQEDVMEIEILEDMYVARLLHHPGETIEPGSPIAILCEDKASAAEVAGMDVRQQHSSSVHRLEV